MRIMTSEPTFLGIVAGDWLQPCVTVFAVVGTILGTLHIERKNREAAGITETNYGDGLLNPQNSLHPQRL